MIQKQEAEIYDIMGAYLFANDRVGVPNEPNTKIESHFWNALRLHYNNSDNAKLSRIWPVIWNEVKKGKYLKLLEPPNVPVYRIAGITQNFLEIFFGVLPEEYQKLKTKMGQTIKIEIDGKSYTPKNFKIGSWTTDTRSIKLENFMLDLDDGIMVMKADPRASGQFLMNPEAVEKELGRKISNHNEKEVISCGPIKISNAVIIFFDDNNKMRNKAYRRNVNSILSNLS